MYLYEGQEFMSISASAVLTNLKNELQPVCAGVIQSLNILWHIHVELGYTVFQVFVQLCNLYSQLYQEV